MTSRREFLVSGAISAVGLSLPRWRFTAEQTPPRGFLDLRRPPDAVRVQTATGEEHLRPVAGGRAANGSGVRVHLVIPKSFNDAQQVADKFKDHIPVVLNLQSTESDLNKRLIDFASGLTYALDGGMQRIADKVFMLTPRDVEISAEERAELIEKGFFNQS